MKIFWLIFSFKQLWEHWKAHNFTRNQNHSSNKCIKLLILKWNANEKYLCSHERWLYYYCLKSGTKWFGINNCDGPFSILLQIVHMTGWISNMTYMKYSHSTQQGTKTEFTLWWGWLSLAHLKLINFTHVIGMWWHAWSPGSSAIHTK